MKTSLYYANTVIFDLDWTMCDPTEFSHLIEGPEPRWEEFHKLIPQFKPIIATIKLNRVIATSHDVMIITGRPDQYRTQTEQWLTRHGVVFNRLFMRPKATPITTPSWEVKREIFQQNTLIGVQFFAAFEDDPLACEMYRKAGLVVFTPQMEIKNE